MTDNIGGIAHAPGLLDEPHPDPANQPFAQTPAFRDLCRLERRICSYMEVIVHLKLRRRRVILGALVALLLVAISVSAAAGPASQGDPADQRSVGHLDLGYGPYLGVTCRRPNNPTCDRVGIDFVLKREASSVVAWIGARRVNLRTPGVHNVVPGRDWVGYMRNAGMLRKGSPLYIPTNEREHDHWLGYPPIVVGIRITATLEDGRPL